MICLRRWFCLGSPSLVVFFVVRLRASGAHCGDRCDDLGPILQMGGCYESGTPEQQRNKMKVIQGPWDDLPDTGLPPPPDARVEALHSVLRHRESIVAVNPGAGYACLKRVTKDRKSWVCLSSAGDGPIIDEALRAALTFLGTGQSPSVLLAFGHAVRSGRWLGEMVEASRCSICAIGEY